MCGLAGFIAPPQGREQGLDTLARMAATMALRGPDEQGTWLGPDGSVGLAHRRLAVIELGPDGRQPMASASGRWVIAYNGEIYNFRQLRSELTQAGARFRGNSDTEVLLAAIEAWGLETALKRSVGMFAFALWDAQERRLSLARDRFGEKPLYYGRQNDVFLFGSELKALRAHPAWQGGIDRDALSLLIRYDYVPAPLSIHPRINKLRPGCWIELSYADGRWVEREAVYWSATEAADRARAQPFRGTANEAAQSVEELLRAVVAGQMVADVPLGAFLSGGIDSSAVVALMQSVASQPVRTFTIGFDDPAYDESPAAAAVAAHLKTRHTARMLGAKDVLDLIPRLPSLYDEPFADASQLPTALVACVAREHVTVALSGDGGDELFGGYNRYVWGDRLWRRLGRFPSWPRRVASHALKSLSPATWDKAFGMLPDAWRQRNPGEKLHKLAGLLEAKDERRLYRATATFWHDGNPVLGATGDPQAHPLEADAWRAGYEFAEQMMMADALTYLPDDVLVKVDRAAMGFSLETRAPFLDHRLFELVWSLPLRVRLDGRETKPLLRSMLKAYMPARLFDRPKTGFALPIHSYLRGALRDWAEALLAEHRLRSEGYFDAAVVRRAWAEHCSGQFNRQYELWSVLMFQAWAEHVRGEAIGPAAV